MRLSRKRAASPMRAAIGGFAPPRDRDHSHDHPRRLSPPGQKILAKDGFTATGLAQ